MIFLTVACASGGKDTQSFESPVQGEQSNRPLLPPGVPNDAALMPPPSHEQDEVSVALTGVVSIDGVTVPENTVVDIGQKNINSTQVNQSSILVRNGAKAYITDGIITKTGDSSSVNQSNFNGLNAGVTVQSGSSLQIQNVVISTDAEGANAIVATGQNASIGVKNVKITTSKNSSRGLHATYKGRIVAENVDIETTGAHCAGLATDRGEGTVVLNKGTIQTAGEGSPVIYSTGDITAVQVTGKATGAEIAAIEGKNSLNMDNCSLTGSGPHAIMLYQSFSGDADVGNSSLHVKDCTLVTTSQGPFFYITNTDAKIDITGTTLTYDSGILLRASGNNGERGWGIPGSNGANVTVNAHDQNLMGDIVCDAISSVRLELDDGATFTGAINTAKEGLVTVSLSQNASWSVTSDSYIGSISDTDSTFSNIQSHGHTIYYDSTDSANAYLQQKTVTLFDGGKLVPYIAQHPIIVKSTKQMPQRPYGALLGNPSGKPPAHF